MIACRGVGFLAYRVLGYSQTKEARFLHFSRSQDSSLGESALTRTQFLLKRLARKKTAGFTISPESQTKSSSSSLSLRSIQANRSRLAREALDEVVLYLLQRRRELPFGVGAVISRVAPTLGGGLVFVLVVNKEDKTVAQLDLFDWGGAGIWELWAGLAIRWAQVLVGVVSVVAVFAWLLVGVSEDKASGELAVIAAITSEEVAIIALLALS